MFFLMGTRSEENPGRPSPGIGESGYVQFMGHRFEVRHDREIDPERINPSLRSLLKFYRKLQSTESLPRRAPLRPEQLAEWLGFLMILDPVDDGMDFHYRLYGSNIAKILGFDMSGRNVSDFDSRTGAFFMEVYRECLRRPQPIFTHHVSEHSFGAPGWERLILPFATDDGIQFIVGNYPDGPDRRQQHGEDLGTFPEDSG
jgi:hypothetical protein